MNKSNNNVNIERLKKAIKNAVIEVENCGKSKCSHIGDIKKMNDAKKECDEKFKNMPTAKLIEKMESINKCLQDKLGDKNLTDKFNKLGICFYENCKTIREKLEKLTMELMNLSNPNHKELKKLTEELSLFEKELENCKVSECSSIYPFDKLKKENEECSKLLLNKDDTYRKCMEKYNLYEKNTKMSKCKKEKCKNSQDKITKINEKLFKLRSSTDFNKLQSLLQNGGKKSKKQTKTKKQKN